MATAGQFYEFPPKSPTSRPSDLESSESATFQSREVSFSPTNPRPLKPKRSILRPSPKASPPISPGPVPDEESPFKTRDKVRRTFAGTAFKALVEGDTTLQRQIHKPDPLDCFIVEKPSKKSNTQSSSVIDNQPEIKTSSTENQELNIPVVRTLNNPIDIPIETEEIEFGTTNLIQEPTNPPIFSHKVQSKPSRKPSECNSDFSDDVSVVVLQRGKSLKSKKFQIETKSQSKPSLNHKAKDSIPYISSNLNPQNNKINTVAPEPPATPDPQKYLSEKRVTPITSFYLNSPSEALELHSKKDQYFNNNPSFPQNAYQPSLPSIGSYNSSSLSSYNNYEKDALIRAHQSHHTNSGSDPYSFQTKSEPTIQEPPAGCNCIIL